MAVTRALLLDRLAGDMEHQIQRKYHASRARMQGPASSQARGSNANSEKDAHNHKYESGLRRIYKYFSEWKTQPNMASSSSSTPSSSSSSQISRNSNLVSFPEKIKHLVSENNEQAAALEKEKLAPAATMAQPTESLPMDPNVPCLPLELHIQILQNLSWREQVRLASVSPTWRSIVTDWLVPLEFRSPTGDTILGPHIINPLFAQLDCELGFSVRQAEDLYTPAGEPVLDQPFCYPPATHLLVRVSDLRTDGLEPAIDDTISVFTTRCCDRNIRIRDVLAAMDKYYRQTNEDRIIKDYKSWHSWKFLLETNRWWRRGYVGLCGQWEWRDGGDWLCLYAQKVTGAWENDFKN
ncbi:hypothetical protein Dda_0211 [Drechslerella dactyloides]|uniref:F-box domain-containing protein n=1 Tax=Drechslerella dactyloides TaxID=74499 RepID=A0AAD6NN95_DREDA|nr:hypothetical protein Dda_0211 [Drechslerella dactyloides]